jgi:hypothetical protein
MAHAETDAPKGMSQDAYRDQGGGLCPQCRSTDVECWPMTFEEGIAAGRRRCLDCTLTWQEMYRLAGYVRESGTVEGDADWDAFMETSITTGDTR